MAVSLNYDIEMLRNLKACRTCRERERVEREREREREANIRQMCLYMIYVLCALGAGFSHKLLQREV